MMKLTPGEPVHFPEPRIVSLISKVTTADRRLTRGRVYQGGLVYKEGGPRAGWRFLITDDKNQRMTFRLDVFVPATKADLHACILGMGK